MIANGNPNRLTRLRRSSEAIKCIASEEIDDGVEVLNGILWFVGFSSRSIERWKNSN